MDVPRRSLLAAFAGVLAGCPQPRDEGARTPADETPSPTPTLAPVDRAPPQSLTVENARAETVYATVVVDPPRGEPFLESRELVPADVVTFDAVARRRGDHDVILELGTGQRTTYRWDVDGRLSGLSVTIHDEITFWPTARCDPVCRLSRDGDAGQVPLVGDGSGYWFGPAVTILRNPTAATRTPRLRITLDGDPVVDYRYAVPPETQVLVPVTYRTGVYRVTVSDGGTSRSDEWHVPQEPRQYVRLGAGTFHCGVESTPLRLSNADDVEHELRVTVDGEGGRDAAMYALAPGESRTVDPAESSGRYLLTATTAAGEAAAAEWWACPPHAPTEVRIDATGAIAIDAPYRVG